MTKSVAVDAPTSELGITSKPWFGWVMALGGSFCFSVATPVGKAILLLGLDSTAVLLARFWLTLVLYFVTASLMQQDRRQIARKDWPYLLFVGVANGAAMLSIFKGLERLDASLVSMFIAVVPLIVLLLLALRGEPLTRRNLFRLGLALGGLYLLIGPGGEPDLLGVVLVLFAMFLFAGGLVTVQWKLQGYDARILSLYVTLIITIVVTFWWFVQGQPWTSPGLWGWVGIAVLAVVGTYMARILLYSAVQRIGSGQTSLLVPLEIVLSVIWAFLFLGERLSQVQVIGGVLVLSSALLAIRRLRRAKWRPRWRGWVRA